MTNSFWRFSHLALAVSSFLFLLLASVTGVILSVEPIIENVKPFGAGNLNNITLAKSLPVLQSNYKGITRVTLEKTDFVLIEGTDNAGNALKAYVDPLSGKILGKPNKKNEFFQWVTNLHRSLFLHQIGRIFIGITSFLLVLISCSGIMLTIKRQRGIRRFLAKIPNDKSAQFYHVVIGRVALIFILLIAISGTILSLTTLNIIKSVKNNAKVNFDELKDAPKKKTADFKVFQNINLSEVQTIEFPFSDDVEDYFILTLKDREVAVNQITGDILAESRYPFSVLLTDWSMDIHTGKTNIIWAIILGISSLSILFFIYSGFKITLKRISKRSKNKFEKEECDYILLVGSENGTTNRFANDVHKLLLKQNKKAYLTTLNNYTVFPKAKQLLIFTSTYGLGEAPTNASKFLTLLDKFPQSNVVYYTVLGFGSKSYPDFCKFAFDLHNHLSTYSWATPLIDVHTVDDHSPQDLMLWQETWSQKNDISFDQFKGFNVNKPINLKTFTVQKNISFENTFLINLKVKGVVKSGDLLAIYPANDYRERLYSIGVVDKTIQLSVKLHQNGLGSGFLNQLKINDKIKARIVKNTHFNFPLKASKVIMIANGTGIAPFLGMIDENKLKKPIFLFSGFKDYTSYQPFDNFLNTKLKESKLKKLNVAYSRARNKQYVSDLIAIDRDFIADCLINEGVIMICGSLSMQKDILVILTQICTDITGNSLSFYQARNQILTDCY